MKLSFPVASNPLNEAGSCGFGSSVCRTGGSISKLSTHCASLSMREVK